MFIVRYRAAVSRNHVHLTNMTTGATVTRTSACSFSSESRLIADPKGAATFIGELIRELEGRRRWFRFLPIVDVTLAGGLTTPEDRGAVRRIFVEHGFVRVRVS
ncbi:hypothetical protein [Sphingomonas sp. S2M10]|uniref:hypothetical protein n=1 Tax=Sphingomonas sp. S2M10 TaxID=2705010 RepID=UPI001B3B28EE|nr:hypothetical protein [Sphingomonas sp. S2M10]